MMAKHVCYSIHQVHFAPHNTKYIYLMYETALVPYGIPSVIHEIDLIWLNASNCNKTCSVGLRAYVQVMLSCFIVYQC